MLGCLLRFATLNHLSPGESKMGGLEGDKLLFKTNGFSDSMFIFQGKKRCFSPFFGWGFFNMHDLGGDSLQVIHAEIRAVVDAICSKKDLVKVAQGVKLRLVKFVR